MQGAPPLPFSCSLDLKEEYGACDGNPQEGDEEQGKGDAGAFVHLAIATTTTVGGVSMSTSRVSTVIQLLIPGRI